MSSRSYIAASWRWSSMCALISLRISAYDRMMSGGCTVDELFSFCNLLFLLPTAMPGLCEFVEAGLRDGISFLWLRTSTKTMMSFEFYRDAIQLHDTPLTKVLVCHVFLL